MSWPPGGEVLVGYVGRLAVEKRVDLLAGLRDVPGIRLVVVGDGPAGPGLRRVLPRARFLGLLQGARLAAVFASLDVFVHTGPYETFCQAAQEALASGVPVVAPAAGGLLDLVAHGVNGRLYPPGSPVALREAVSGLAGDPDLRVALARAARPSVSARDWEAVGDDYLRHCQEIRHDPRRSLSA